MDRSDDSGDVQFIGQLPSQTSKDNLCNVSVGQPLKQTAAPGPPKRGIVIKYRPKRRHKEALVASNNSIVTDDRLASELEKKEDLPPNDEKFSEPKLDLKSSEPKDVCDKTPTVSIGTNINLNKKSRTIIIPPITIPAPVQQMPLNQQKDDQKPTQKSAMSPSLKKVVDQTPFSWQKYLLMESGPIAPREAFNHSIQPLVNKFKPGMKLVAQDPRNKSDTWCLASIILFEGPRLKLRFDGGDTSNDFFELTDSKNIRPYKQHDILFAPMGFKGDIASYPRFLEKTLLKDGVEVAPPEMFSAPPRAPGKNLFKAGMKLEAVDMKNPYLICPATVKSVCGDDVAISLDGWSDGYSFTCKFYSRNIFPVGWCEQNNHYIAAPKDWEFMVQNGRSPPLSKHNARNTSNAKSSPTANKESNPSSKLQTRTSISNGDLSRTTSTLKTPRKGEKFRSSAANPSPKVRIATPRKNESKRTRPNSPDLHSPLKNRAKRVVPPIQTNLGLLSSTDEEDCDGAMVSNEPRVRTIGFQCQRTVPYDEWLKSKNRSSQVCNHSQSTTDEYSPNCTYESRDIISSDQQNNNRTKHSESKVQNNGKPPQNNGNTVKSTSNFKSTPTINKELHLSMVQLQPRSSLPNGDSIWSPGQSLQQAIRNLPRSVEAGGSPNSPRAGATARRNEDNKKRSPIIDFFAESRLRKANQVRTTNGPVSSTDEDCQDESMDVDEPRVQTIGFQCQRTVPYDEWLKTKDRSSSGIVVDQSQRLKNR